jgi:hypothetical protein
VLTRLVFLVACLFTVESFGQSHFYADQRVAIERAKIISLALCSHETNKHFIAGDPKSLSFFNFTISRAKVTSLEISGYCNLTQNHTSMLRKKSSFNLNLTTTFPLNVKEGYDYGYIGAYKVRIRWTLENTNLLMDPFWQKFLEVRYHSLELYPDIPLLGLWSPLNPLRLDIESMSDTHLQAVAIRNLRGVSVSKKSADVYHLNYQNFEQYYRGADSGKAFAQGIGINLSGTVLHQVFGCIYSSYFGDGSIETLMDRNKCDELRRQLRPE